MLRRVKPLFSDPILNAETVIIHQINSSGEKKIFFENLTLAPIEKDLINFNLLTKLEKNYDIWERFELQIVFYLKLEINRDYYGNCKVVINQTNL